MNITAVLLDTIGIQSYVFGSNQLKDNIGASYMVDSIYCEYIEQAIFQIEDNLKIKKSWEKDYTVKIFSDTSIDIEFGYIGGGNALLLFKEKKNATDFIKLWTKLLLIQTPSLNVAVAFKEDVSESDLNSNYKEFFKHLQDKINESKYKNLPSTTLLEHGITSPCMVTDSSAEVYLEAMNKNDTGKYLSSIAYSKRNKETNKAAKEKLKNEFKLDDQFKFTDDLEELGQEKGKKNFIAVVHIDGNGIGKKFEDCKSLSKARELSSKLKDRFHNAFQYTLDIVVKKNLIKNNIIPLRPIIIGGDDITFVSEGTIGIFLAKTFIEELEKLNNSELTISACAGICIANTKYPFYRVYSLAEQACASAKEQRKKANSEASWIDFHIHTGVLIGNLKELRKEHYSVSNRNLLMRPYQLSGGVYSIESVLENTKNLFYDGNSVNSGLVHEVRNVLYDNQAVQEMTFQNLKAKYKEGFEMLEFGEEVFKKYFFSNDKTPYFDMIELSEFYKPMEQE
jgi:hypothetical protein